MKQKMGTDRIKIELYCIQNKERKKKSDIY